MRTRTRAYQQSNIWPIPTDLLGRIFSCLPAKERWRHIPLVCQEWRQAHNAYPPEQSELKINEPIKEGKRDWAVRIAPSLQRLIYNFEEGSRSDVVQFLGLLAQRACRLKHLVLENCMDEWNGMATLPHMAAFSTITRLTCSNIELRPGKGRLETESLSGLCSLQDLDVVEFDWELATIEMAECLWTTLGSLPRLTSVCFHLIHGDYPEQNGMLGLNLISQMTNLRSVTLHNADPPLESGLLAQALGTMIQLHHLDLEVGNLPSLNPITSLTRLQSLKLLLSGGPHHGSLPLQSTNLTELHIAGSGMWDSASELLPPTAPCLGSLKRLILRVACLEQFPKSLADALGQLQHLDLCNNIFVRIPEAVSRMHDLQELSLKGNAFIQLRPKDVDVLRALPELKCLDVSGGLGSQINRGSIGILMDIARKLPAIHLPGFDYVPENHDYYDDDGSDDE